MFCTTDKVKILDIQMAEQDLVMIDGDTDIEVEAGYTLDGGMDVRCTQ